MKVLSSAQRAWKSGKLAVQISHNNNLPYTYTQLTHPPYQKAKVPLCHNNKGNIKFSGKILQLVKEAFEVFRPKTDFVCGSVKIRSYFELWLETHEENIKNNKSKVVITGKVSKLLQGKIRKSMTIMKEWPSDEVACEVKKCFPNDSLEDKGLTFGDSFRILCKPVHKGSYEQALSESRIKDLVQSVAGHFPKKNVQMIEAVLRGLRKWQIREMLRKSEYAVRLSQAEQESGENGGSMDMHMEGEIVTEITASVTNGEGETPETKATVSASSEGVIFSSPK